MNKRNSARISCRSSLIGSVLLLVLPLSPCRADDPPAPEGLKLLQQAAEEEDPQAQYKLGKIYSDGTGITKNRVLAYKWLTLAASQGESDAAGLIKELELFMTPEQLAEGKRLAVGAVFPTNRLTVAILGLENKTGDAAAAHWREASRLLILDEVKSLRFVGGVQYAQRQLKMKEGDPIDAAQARKLGELLEARRVVWGYYQRQASQWLVSIRVLNVGTAKCSEELKAASTNWFEIRDRLAEQLLAQLDVVPTDSERPELARRFTSSPVALESIMKGAFHQRTQQAEAEAYARNAVAEDPECAEARCLLPTRLYSRGKLEEAEKEARQAFKLKPRYARAHSVLGAVLTVQGDAEKGEKEFRAAVRLDPDESESLQSLGAICESKDQLDEARSFFQRALRLNPLDSSPHASFGLFLAKQQKRDEALASLKTAERLALDEDFNTEQFLALAYERLREIPPAIEHYERFVTLGRKAGLNPAGVAEFEETLQALKARLAPTYVDASPPKEQTEQALAESLREKLTPEERGLVINPLASTPEMKAWARELTSGATNNLDKARRIFDGLAHRLQTGDGGTRTAQEVFARWKDAAESFSCQEYAKLYVALARTVGLRVFYVHLERDYRDEVVYHDCAALFDQGKCLLVDPAYFWFGVPHKHFAILDDVKAIAHHLFQPTDATNDLALHRLAAKLHPDTAWGQLQLCSSLIDAEKLDEAARALEEALRLEPGRWDGYLFQGMLAARAGRLKEAESYFRDCLRVDPGSAKGHDFLGRVLEAQDHLREARAEYRLALEHPQASQKQQLLDAIARLNEKLGGN